MLLFTTLGGNVREPLDVDIHTKRSLHFHPEWQTRRMSRCLHRWFQGLPRPMCRLCCRVFIANVKAPTCSPLHLYDYQRSQFQSPPLAARYIYMTTSVRNSLYESAFVTFVRSVSIVRAVVMRCCRACFQFLELQMPGRLVTFALNAVRHL